ncbi:TlpA disulfide reductase family protein [Hymenobacter sp. BT770]|uniref:TlpA family protein disulfide reductase n=1 Tax=Hymenobacter sp. BT770 TaxID=2886942 RepID=UPI001D12F0DB|nr:TlpA disulfide reductase family protein [Hymenobacter sp. BT770]MCC3153329.1 TlpA family protein disulfide reductase [Hymenobacter sp. BT770]MDO3414324.1 TlpA disulfide reductase family protein [Hymenobacter sp. BT770]
MNYLSALAFSLLLATTAHAQAPSPVPTAAPRPTIQVTEKSSVIDAAGNPLAYPVWRQMLATSEFKLRAAPGSSAAAPVFQVVARTPEERAAYLAQLPAPQESPFFTTGQTLAPFKLRDVNGRKYDSKDLAGKIVVLNFWFIGCPPCRAEIPELNKLVQQNAKRDDVVFLAVALDQRGAIEKFTQQFPLEYAIVADGRYVAEKYGVRSYPTNLVLDRQGKVVFHTQIHPDIVAYLQKAIDEVK